MTRKKSYLLIQTVLCILLAGMLIMSTVRIYREGAPRREQSPLESIYTPESAADAFAPAAPLLCISVCLLIAGLVTGWEDEHAKKPVKDVRIIRDLAVSRVSVPTDTMKKEQSLRKKLIAGGWLGFALCMLPVIAFMADPAHFPMQDTENMFYSLLRVLLPWIAAGLGILAVTSALREKSFIRETKAAKVRIKEEMTDKSSSSQTGNPGSMQSALIHSSRMKHPAVIQTAVVVAAVVFIIMGIFNGSARDVMAKAVRICTECVGLG